MKQQPQVAPVAKTAEQLANEIREMQTKLKALKAEAKPKKESKGIPVTFKNKAGEVISGPGVLYYVVRQDGKLHYKEASQVTVVAPV